MAGSPLKGKAWIRSVMRNVPSYFHISRGEKICIIRKRQYFQHFKLFENREL